MLDGVCEAPFSNECKLDTISVSSARLDSSSFSRASMVVEGLPERIETAPSDSSLRRIASHPVRSSISSGPFGNANLTRAWAFLERVSDGMRLDLADRNLGLETVSFRLSEREERDGLVVHGDM